jgi:ABC-type branched-subunit amino acid transport system permease subunit
MKNRKYLIAFFIAALVFLPWLLNDPFITHLGVRAATYAIVVMGLILFAHYDGFIDPDRLGIYVSVLFLIMAFVGGIGNLYGSILGAFALTIVEEYFQEFGQYNVLAYGLMLAIVILFLPKGLVDLPNKLKLRKAK